MLPVLMLPIMHFFEEVLSLILSLLGFGMLAVVFLLGGAVATWLKNAITSTTDLMHFNLNTTLVNVIAKGLIAVVALILSAPAMPPLTSVVDAMIPVGDFNEISAGFAAQEGRFLVNTVFDIVLEQIGLTFAYFIPFILVDMVVSFLAMFLCDRDAESSIASSVVLYALDLFALFAVNTFVLYSGTFFMEVMLKFLRTIDISLGIGRFLILCVVFMLMLFFVIRDVLTTDILVAILGVNVTAALMQVTIGDANRWYILAISIVCGLAARIIKHLVLEDVDSFVLDAICALVTLVGTALISALVLLLVRIL